MLLLWQAVSDCAAVCMKPWVLPTPPLVSHAIRYNIALLQQVQGSTLASAECIRAVTSMVVTLQ